MWVLPVPLPLFPPPLPRTFAKRDAVQVAALEEAGLDGARLQGEQPALPPAGQAQHAPSPAPVGATSPSPSSHGVPQPVTWGMVFIRLYLCTSSSFEGIRCCPFPIPAEKRGGGHQSRAGSTPGVTQGHMPQTETATLGAPALRPNPGNPPKVSAAAFGA